MTTTAMFQHKPDFYTNKEDCVQSVYEKVQTNPRYRKFKQNIFTVGDEQQFQFYRDAANDGGRVCLPNISLLNNLFVDLPCREWEKYKDLHANAVINTFRYIFNKFKISTIQGDKFIYIENYDKFKTFIIIEIKNRN